jgi:hypothetical protein
MHVSASMSDVLLVLSQIWIVTCVGLCLGLVLWFYSSIWAIASGPTEAAVFRLSKGESRVVRTALGRRHASRVRRRFPRAGDCGPYWSLVTTQLLDDYVLLRTANAILFMISGALAWALLGLGVLQLTVALPSALLLADGATASGSVALFAASCIPRVLTISAVRLRWRRRAPFEARFLHEAALLLSKYQETPAKAGWERADLLPDLSDLLFVLANRYVRKAGVTDGVRNLWSSAVARWLVPSLYFQATLGPAEGEAHAFARTQVESASRLLICGTWAGGPHVAPKDPLPRVRYSADLAAGQLLLGLVGAIIAFSLIFLWFAEESPVVFPTWVQLQPALQVVAVALSAGVSLGAIVDRWRKRVA